MGTRRKHLGCAVILSLASLPILNLQVGLLLLAPLRSGRSGRRDGAELSGALQPRVESVDCSGGDELAQERRGTGGREWRPARRGRVRRNHLPQNGRGLGAGGRVEERREYEL